MDVTKEYQKLFAQSRYAHVLGGVTQLLDWDQETYMPEGAAEIRGEQLKALAGILHQEKVSRKFAGPLAKLIHLDSGKILAKGLTKRQQSALREWRRDYLIDIALPKRFVEEFAELCSRSIVAWREARKNNDFKAFAPFLKKIIAVNQKKADYIGFKKHPYDALLDLYEPGMTTTTISTIFDDLKKGNVALLKQISKAQQIDDSFIYGHYEEDKQLALSKQLLQAMGYDFKHGRLDLSTHPFSSAFHPTDSRVTTRLHADDIFSCISTVLHEGGHSLYEMGLPSEEFGSPLGTHISMGIHESQSRFWETRIGLSKPFMQFLLPLVQKSFPKMLQKVDVAACYRAVNKVEPSFIRVEADEVTYPLHVILRFELEKALMEGSLEINDLPSAWNEKMQKYLGITPPNDTKGCLQDIHWAMGAFGYFPTYALGNLYAAQFFTQFAKTHPDWEKKVAKGELLFIRDFLHENVYRYGREFDSQALIQKVTGKPFSANDYVTYLKRKYGEIYKL